MFQLLSRAPARPVNRSHNLRCWNRDKDPNTFRVAAGLDSDRATPDESNLYAMFKHHLAFIIQTADLRDNTFDDSHVLASDPWR